MTATSARSHRVFGGKLERDQLNFGERAVVKVVSAPYGDYRDWPEVTNWVRDIADSLRSPPAPIGPMTSRRENHPRGATAEAGAGGSAWMVCFGATREVSGGLVSCPRAGTVSLGDSLACHLLVTIAAERDPRLACATAE